jgi:hypothetical protein
LTERRKATSGHQQNTINNILLQDRREKMLLITTVKQLYSSFIYPMRSSTDAARNMPHLCHLKLGDQKHKADKTSLIKALPLEGLHKDNFIDHLARQLNTFYD